MTQELGTSRTFKGKITNNKVVSIGGKYPISHAIRELKRNVGEDAVITIKIGK